MADTFVYVKNERSISKLPVERLVDVLMVGGISANSFTKFTPLGRYNLLIRCDNTDLPKISDILGRINGVTLHTIHKDVYVELYWRK